MTNRKFLRALVYALTLVLAFPPHIFAGALTPDPNAGPRRPGVDAAGNGVPIVNIVKPDASGLSHNQYHDFNVGQPGLILNNSARPSQTQLGAIIGGNANFGGADGARAILNEVTSSNRSHIQGYIEVGGKAADVILANPNGITVNGGGFINTPSATLTTGKPVIGPNGLAGFEVRQGDIRIEGAGINARNVDAFSLISHTAELSADVYANHLNMVLGKNDVAADGTVSAVTPDAHDPNPAPVVSLDTSLLGGMYANSISLTATQKGVGVNLEGMVQTTNDLYISADGKLSVRQASAGGKAAIKAAEVQVGESLYATNALDVQAETLSTTGGFVASGGDVRISAHTVELNNATVGAGVDASGFLSKAKNLVVEADTVVLDESALYAGATMHMRANSTDWRNTTAHADTIALGISHLTMDATTFQAQAMALAADTLGLAHGTTLSAGHLSMAADRIDLSDTTLYADILDMQADNAALANSELIVSNKLGIDVRTSLDLDTLSALITYGDAGILADNLSNNGLIFAANDITFGIRNTLSNTDGGTILAGGDISVTGRIAGERAGKLYNRGATIESMGGSLSLYLDELENTLGPVHVAQRESERIYWTENTYVTEGWDADGNRILVDNSTRYKGSNIGNPLQDEWRPYVNQKYGINQGRPYNGRISQNWIVTTEQYIAESYTPTSILAAGNVFIDANRLINDKSTISAGNNLFITAKNLVNTGLELSRLTDIWWRFMHISLSGGYDTESDWHYFVGEVYASLPALLTAKNAVVLDVEGTIDLSGVKEGYDFIGENAGYPGTEFPDYQSGSNALPLPGGVGSLFKVSADPDHPYLYETNPALSNWATFYGSEYFLSRMGLDLDGLHRRLLGDAFYETRLVSEQMFRATGQRVLDGVGSETDQMMLLMDNAAAQAGALNLEIGVSLTADQIAALTSDIIWLEEQVVNGETVLVPVLYLAQATLDTLEVQRGSQVKGSSVLITADTLTNSGLVTGSEVQIAVTDMLNRGGNIQGGNYVAINAENDIVNRSGTIGGGDIYLAAGNDIINETATRRMQGVGNTHTAIDQIASINASGNVVMQAGNDIAFAGSRLDAGGTAAMTAGNDITFGTQRLTSEFAYTYQKGSSSRHMGSSVTAGELNISAGRDLVVAGSALGAEGDATLSAGRSAAFLAVNNESSFNYNESGGGSSHTIDSYRSTVQGSAVLAGGNLSISAGGAGGEGGHITAVGSMLGSQGDTTLSATGDVIITSAEETHMFAESKSRKNMFSSRAELNASGSTTQVGSEVFGDNVTIHAGDNVLVAASDITAQNDLALRADTGDVMVIAGQDTWWEHSESKKSKFHLGNVLTAGLGSFFSDSGGVMWSSQTEKAQSSGTNSAPSFLTAGNNITIDAGRDVGIVGSYVDAGNDIGLSAGRDVNILAGRESYSSEYEKTSKKVGLWTSLKESGFGAFAGLKSETEGAKRTGDYSAGSFLSAGNDVTITAGRDLNQIGSHISAGRDATIDVGQDWNMLASYDHETLHQWVKTIESGISASASQNVTGAARSLIDLPKNASAGRGGIGYSALTAGSEGLRAIDAVKGATSSPLSVSAKLGSSHSSTDYRSSNSTARPSSITAGRDVDVTTGRDINIEGGLISGGRDVYLDARRDLNIVAARNRGDSDFSSSSGGGGVGVKGVFGSGAPAFGININAEASGSRNSDTYDTHINAVINAGDTLYTNSGRDTNIAGAHLEADNVWMDVGRDLSVASIQDSYESKNSSWNAGFDVTVGKGINVGGSYGKGSGSGSSRWVGEQTSIVGRKDVDIYVEGNTHLKGSIIATEEGGTLTLNTGTLTYEEIHDYDRSRDEYYGISGNTNIPGVGFEDAEGPFGKWLDYSQKGSGPYMPDSVEYTLATHDKEGVLRPTITDGDIIVRDDPDADLSGLNRDIDRAREITKDESTYVGVYVSPDAIKEVLNGFGDVLSEIEQYAEALGIEIKKDIQTDVQILHEMLAENLLAEGYSPQEINELMNLSDGSGMTFVSLLSLLSPSVYLSASAPLVNVKFGIAGELFLPQDGFQTTIMALARIASLIETFSPEQRKIAMVSVNLATGGPMKVIINEAIDVALDISGASKMTAEWIDSIASSIMDKVYENSYNVDLSSSYSDYELQKIEEQKEFLQQGVGFGVGAIILGIVNQTGPKIKTAYNSKGELLGKNGPKIESKTIYLPNRFKGHLDIENGKPGVTPGQIHYQVDGNKYLYDVANHKMVDYHTGLDAPNKINGLLKDKTFVSALNKALKYLGE